MKGTPGILEKAFPSLFDADNGRGKSKHVTLNEDFFYLLAQNARDIIFHLQLKPEHKFDYVSPSCFPITGYTPEEFYADPYLTKKCIHPEDLNLLSDPNAPDFKAPPEPVEIRWFRKDGVMIWTEHSITYDRDTKGIFVSCQIIARDITERKKAEEALVENQIFTSSLLENAPHAIVVMNADSSVKYVNPAWEKLNGWSLTEVIGLKAPYPWWPEELKEDFLKGFEASMKQGSGKAEIIAQKRNGEIYWIDMNWASVTNNGKLEYLIINSIDITERKRAEKAIQDSEEKFSKAFQSSPNIMAIISAKDGRYIEVNESFTKNTGYTKEEVIKRTQAELNIWENKEDRARMMRMLREQGRIFNEEFNFRVKSGEIHTMLFSIDQIKIGDEPCLISVCSDVTERKKVQAALRESEEKFAQVYNSSPNAICLMSVKEHKFLEANESFYRFTGYCKEEIFGHNHIDLKLCEKEEDQAFIGKSLQETGRVFNKRITCKTKSGVLCSGLFSADTIEVGGEKCYIIVITDITEQIKAEEALRESEEKFAKAFRGSPEIIAITSLKDGRYIDVNDSYTYFTGYSREELIGKDTETIDIWANKEDRDERLQILIEQGRVNNKEYDFRTKSGEIRTWLYSAEPITIGGEMCLMSASIDITERKRMQETIANEAIRRRILIEQSSDGIVILDQNGKVYDVNWRFAEMLGYTMDEATNLYLWDWDCNFSREKLIEMLKDANAEGDHFISKHKCKDGTIIDVDISTNGATFAGQKLIFCVCRDISERNRIEKALRESEEKFALAFNSSPHMFIITDIETGNYLEVNDTFVNNTGYSREELIGHNVNELNLWAKPAEFQKMNRQLNEQGSFKNEEYSFRNKSGEIRIWLCSSDVVTIGGKKRFLAIAADITERKKAEEALRESEELFSRAFNASPISMSISRLGDGKFIEVNESFLRDKGYTRDEVIGYSSKKIGVWQNVAEQHKIMGLLKTQGRAHNIPMHYKTKSGDTRVGLVSAELVKIGNESCMLVLNNDITQQKQAEEQLRLLSSVTKQVSDSTIITDPDFNITFMNQAAEDLFGYSFEEVKGKSLSIFNKAPVSDEHRQLIKKTMAAGKVYSIIIPKRRKDGTTIICDCRISPMYDEDGNICSLIDVQRDITKQKDVEAKLQEHKKLIDSILATMPEGVLVIDNQDRILLANKSLYKILHLNSKLMKNKSLSEVLPLDQYFNIHRAVNSRNNENNTLEFRYNVQDTEKIIYCVIVKMDGERTLITFADISGEREEEEKLYLTDRLASIGEMAAGLAHELNNPLTGILTLSQLLVSSDIPKAQKEDIECIYSEAKRAAGIVKNVLLFARNKPDESGQASANDVIKDVLRLREYEQRSSNIKVVTELEENLPDIPIDKGQLQQVFLNMISNAEAAIKEANRPGILTVTTQRVNNHINIHFSDNGCGIKKQIMPRIFDPFFTTKEVGKGTGLGLSICYSIIVKHGGKINVKSQVNEGTTFTIRMPVVD